METCHAAFVFCVAPPEPLDARAAAPTFPEARLKIAAAVLPPVRRLRGPRRRGQCRTPGRSPPGRVQPRSAAQEQALPQGRRGRGELVGRMRRASQSSSSDLIHGLQRRRRSPSAIRRVVVVMNRVAARLDHAAPSADIGVHDPRQLRLRRREPLANFSPCTLIPLSTNS